MQRSAQRRSPAALRNRRVIAVGAVVLVVGGMLAVTQMSDASTRRWGFFGSRPQQHQAACPTSSPTRRWNTQRDLATSQNGRIENHAGDGQSTNADAERAARQRGRQRDRQCTPSGGASATSSPGSVNDGDGDGGSSGGSGSTGSVPPGGADGNNNGLDVLGRDCTVSQLNAHDGFQNAPACVSTQFGEVSSQEKNPSLLITEHPDEVGVNEAFSFTVSTRNLVRDRFLGAAAGGYYLESSFLNQDGLQRGHFHSGCQLLQSADEAPNPDRAQFFVATEDGAGGAEPDSVTINVPGLAAAGTYRCASWAGDPSHRIPMMQFANQQPAFDTFRLEVQ